ncbi:DUF4381 domain-containing protein [Neiella marina]|uniref:DUF4381 domain-containing protein n=1 Tax=Neiella holothuriorum TaxID=2870530 RepID=A0ABS7EET1_9GAMM|nr:DUF4381 domain-containing protein [Neiella holothuriorum]MBW8190433.1 DUF4381 domain-containing protein [Neiella holothuriorum]
MTWLLTTAATAAQPAAETQLPIKDIMIAQAVSWWPLAPGWWVLIALVMLAIVAMAWQLIRRHQKQAISRLAVARVTSWQPAEVTAEQCNALLKAVALHYARPEQTEALGALSGTAWLNWLQASTPNKHKSAVEAMCQALETNLYQPAKLTSEHQQLLLNGAQQWLQHSWQQIPRTPFEAYQPVAKQPATAEVSS